MNKKLLAVALIVGSLTLTPAAHAAVPGNPAPVYGNMDSIVRTGQAIGEYASTAYVAAGSYLNYLYTYGWASYQMW